MILFTFWRKSVIIVEQNYGRNMKIKNQNGVTTSLKYKNII